MPPHSYLRALARVLGRQPRLGPPPGVNFTRVGAEQYARLMPYTHPISDHRGRSFEQRHLELWVADFPQVSGPVQPQSNPSQTHPAAAQETIPAASNSSSPVPIASGPHSHPVGAPNNPRLDSHSIPQTAECQLTTAALNPPTTTQHLLPRSSTCGGTSASGPADSALDSARHGNVQGASKTAAEEPAPGPSTLPARTQPCPQQHHHHHQQQQQQQEHQHPQQHHQQKHHHQAHHYHHHGRHHHPPSDHANTTHRHPPLPPPPHSYLEIRYPFTSQPALRQSYLRSTTATAAPADGLLDPVPFIEDFDTFAADVAARHVGCVPDSMLVTACMERFTWHFHPLHDEEIDGEGNGERNQDGKGEGLAAAATMSGGGYRNEAGGGHPGATLAPVDMHLAGQVAWVGRSSLEVLLQLTVAPASETSPPSYSPPPPPSADQLPPSEPSGAVRLQPGQLVASGEFLMALRDTSLRRAVEVPPLHPLSALERELFRRGRERQHERQMRRNRKDGTHGGTAAAAAAAVAVRDSLTVAALSDGSVAEPSQDVMGAAAARQFASETTMTTQSYDRKRGRDACIADKVGASGAQGTTASASTNSSTQLRGGEGVVSCENTPVTVPIRHTEVHRTIVARHEDRNTSGTVFGGHLLRLAYEQAAAAAEAFVGAPCELLWLEEGVISAPARVGDELHVSGWVVWTEADGQVLRVVARVWRQDGGSPEHKIPALALCAAFLAPQGSCLRAVVPTEPAAEAEALAAKQRHATMMAALAREETPDEHVPKGP